MKRKHGFQHWSNEPNIQLGWEFAFLVNIYIFIRSCYLLTIPETSPEVNEFLFESRQVEVWKQKVIAAWQASSGEELERT